MAEPAFVLDNSIAMTWCFHDEWSVYGRAVHRSLDFVSAVAPSIWPLEASNVLLVGMRRKRISEADVIRNIEMLQELNITIEHHTPDWVWGQIFLLAKEHKLSTYDASYLDLAIRMGLPIATQDDALLNAAAACGVPVYYPDPGHKWD